MVLNRIIAALSGLLVSCLMFPLVAWSAETTSYGDWELECRTRSDSRAACTISQLNKRRGTEEIVMRSEIVALKGDGFLLSMKVPQDVLLTTGPWLTIDGLYVEKLTYHSCSGGCVATLVLNQQILPFFIQGKRGVLTVVLTSGQRIGITLSLTGITSALKALKAKDAR